MIRGSFVLPRLLVTVAGHQQPGWNPQWARDANRYPKSLSIPLFLKPTVEGGLANLKNFGRLGAVAVGQLKDASDVLLFHLC